MPCTITGSFEGDARLAAAEANEEATRATQIACEAMRLLKRHSLLVAMSDASLEWFSHHEKIDLRRIENDRREQERYERRTAALAKLTREEREELGL
jgi:hypothetical protein